MTLEEYMDPKRFPLTTQGNLKPSQQLMIDAFNIDKFKELEEEGKLTTDRQRRIWEELQQKEAVHAEMTRLVAAQEAEERAAAKKAQEQK